jgi:hypothetical protein
MNRRDILKPMLGIDVWWNMVNWDKVAANPKKARA